MKTIKDIKTNISRVDKYWHVDQNKIVWLRKVKPENEECDQ